jgi:formate--tetrahydrofolate ligase
VVAINCFTDDTPGEIALLRDKLAHQGVRVVPSEHWARGGEGAADLAQAALETLDSVPADVRLLYDDAEPLWKKINTVARKIYGAREVIADTRVRARIRRFEEKGYGHFPVCFAKTQYSFSTDPLRRGAPAEHVIPVTDVSLSAGAEFLVVLCGDIMTMPGLPLHPASDQIDLDDKGNISGLA